jgi:hypothetical protein
MSGAVNQEGQFARMDFSQKRNGKIITEGFQDIIGDIIYVYQVNYLTKEVSNYHIDNRTGTMSEVKTSKNWFKFTWAKLKIKAYKLMQEVN